MTNIDASTFAAFILILLSVFLLQWVASRRQRQLREIAVAYLQQQEQTNRQLKRIDQELRRHTRLLSELLDEAANSPDYEEPLYELEDEVLAAAADDAIPIEPTTGSAKVQAFMADFSTEVISSSRKIYVGNLHYAATEEELFELFEGFGDIESVNIPLNRYNGKARGFGFVTFLNETDAQKAAQNMNGASFKNRPLQVNFAKER